MKNIFSAILALSMTVSTLVKAENESLVFPVNEGAPSPISGLLLSQKAVADIVADKKLEPERVSAQVSKAQEIEKANCKLQISSEKNECDKGSLTLQSQIKLRDNQIKELDKQLIEVRESNQKLPYYFLGGLVGGTVLTILATITTVKLSN